MRPGTIADTQRGPNRGRMAGEYRLDAQVGYMLRQANQRHTTLFASAMIENLTPTQWAAYTLVSRVILNLDETITKE